MKGFGKKLTKCHRKGENALTRCIGMNPDGRVDFGWGHLYKRECFLICSDGFCRQMRFRQMMKVLFLNGGRKLIGKKLSEKEEITRYHKRLEKIADYQIKHGMQDNLSAILVWRN